MDKHTAMANGLLGLSGIGLIGVFWKEVLLAVRQLFAAASINSDFSKNRG